MKKNSQIDNLTFDEKNHKYYLDEVEIPNVTSILDVISKPQLLGWAIKQDVGYIKENIFELTLKELYSEKLEEFLEGAKNYHNTIKLAAANRGTKIHKEVENYIKTGEETKEIETFISWSKDNKIKFIDSERRVVSKKYLYAGTLDILINKDNKVLIADIKTGSNIYNEAFFQTSAYQNALQEAGVKIDGRIIIRLDKGNYIETIESYDFEKDFSAFLGALAIYNRLKEI